MTGKRVIIIGGGFAGVQCAKALCCEVSPAEAEIVLFNRENHLVFSPLLAEVVGSSINPLNIVVPLRQLLPRIHCRMERVRNLHFDANEIEHDAEDGLSARMHYDHLVIACGNVTNLNVVPGMADHGLPLKTMADAAELRSHLMEQMEKAEVTADPERRAWHLTFIVVGGGFSGAEVAGEINDLVRDSARYFRNWKPAEAKVVLVHSRDQILPEISPRLRDFARRKMENAGVNIVLNARVASATPEGVSLGDGRVIKAGTIVCTIGNSAAPIVASFKGPKQHDRLTTEPDMRLTGLRNVWAIGDCGFTLNAKDQQPSPTTGQFAERQGRQCGQNIARVLRGEPTRPFCFKQLGELC